MPHTNYPFAHRPLSDETCDSICKRCMATVRSGGSPQQLLEAEAAHVCDPWRLEVFRIVAAKAGEKQND